MRWAYFSSTCSLVDEFSAARVSQVIVLASLPAKLGNLFSVQAGRKKPSSSADPGSGQITAASTTDAVNDIDRRMRTTIRRSTGADHRKLLVAPGIPTSITRTVQVRNRSDRMQHHGILSAQASGCRRRSCRHRVMPAASSSGPPTSVGLACHQVGAWRRQLMKLTPSYLRDDSVFEVCGGPAASSQCVKPGIERHRPRAW